MALQIGREILRVTICTLLNLQERAEFTGQDIDPDFRKFRGSFDRAPKGNVLRRLSFATTDKSMPHEDLKAAILAGGVELADVDDQIALAAEHPVEQVSGSIVQLLSTAKREKVADYFWKIDVSILDFVGRRKIITTGECTDNRVWDPTFHGKPYRFLVRLPEIG